MASWTTFDDELLAYWSGVMPTNFVTARPLQGLNTWTRWDGLFQNGMQQGTGGWVRDKCYVVSGPAPDDSGMDLNFVTGSGRPHAHPGLPNSDGIFSVSVWVYNIQKSATISQGGSALAGTSVTRSPIRRSNTGIPATDNELGYRRTTFAGCGYFLTDICEDEQWHHILVTSDGNTPCIATYYVDGIMVGQASHPGGPILGDWRYALNDSNGDDQFGEKYAELAIWTRELTSTEAGQVYGYGITGHPLKELLPQMQLIDNATEDYNSSWVYMSKNELLLHLDTDSEDSSGNARHGILQNGINSGFTTGLTLYSGSGPETTTAPYATEFTDCYEQDPGLAIALPRIRCSLPSTLNIGGSDSRTLMIWAKCPTWKTDAHIWSMGATSARARFNLSTIATNTIRLRFGTPGSQNVSYTFPGANTEWTHYAVTTNASDVMRLYVNGEQEDHNSMSSPLATSDVNFVRLGIEFDTGDASEYWEGQLQEFAVFSREMSAVEIKNIYDTQKEKVALPPLPNLGPTGNSVNDNLIWSWGWELNASLFPYANEAVEPLTPFSPSNADWVPINYHPPADHPFGTPMPYVPANPIFGEPGGLSLGDPYWPGISPVIAVANRRYPWGADWCIQPNFNDAFSRSRFFRYGWQDLSPAPPAMIAGVGNTHLGPSQNAIPGKTYGAGTRCLVLSATNQTSYLNPENDEPVHAINFDTPPLLYTPHIGKYNRAISSSADPDVPGATETRGPRQGWLQTSWKQICNLYRWTAVGAAQMLSAEVSPGGSKFIPILTMERGYRGQGSDEEMLIGLYPVDQEPDPLMLIRNGGIAPPGYPQTTRDVMLAIAPAWVNGIGPDSFPAPVIPGPTFTITNDLATPLWKRIAIQFEFVGDPNNALGCSGYISASVYVDGTYMTGARVDKVPGQDTYKDWNRIGFGSGVYPSLFDHSFGMIHPGWGGKPGLQAAVGAPGDQFFSCFGMHDHVFLWGATGSEGTSSYYIQGLNPTTDIDMGGWNPFGANITPGENWSTVDDRMNPDMWFRYPAATPVGLPSETIPSNFSAFRNDITQSNHSAPPPANTYKFSLQKTTDIDPAFKPANIRSVQQISNHGWDEEATSFNLQYVYTTMSIGTTLVDSWPGPHISFPADPPDELSTQENPYSTIVYILSSASHTGDLWTYEQLNAGTGSLYATNLT